MDGADRGDRAEGVDDGAGQSRGVPPGGPPNRSVACVARDLGVGWSTVMAAVADHGRPLVDDPKRTAQTCALGLDEIAFLRANARRHTTFATNFVDLDRGRLLDVVPGRSAKAVHDWLATRSPQWRAGVATVAIDPFRGYANGVAVHLGRFTVVVDPFHVIALANRAIDDVRRRVQNETLGHRGRSGDPLYEIRRLLLRGIERHTEASRARLDAGLADGDPRDELLDTLLAKETLRSMYVAGTSAEAARRLDAFLAECRDSTVPELHRLKTVSRWRKEILAHHSTGASNGPTEAVNLVVKKVIRVAHGFRSFKNFRLRVLLHCGVDGKMLPPRESEAALPVWSRRAGFVPRAGPANTGSAVAGIQQHVRATSDDGGVPRRWSSARWTTTVGPCGPLSSGAAPVVNARTNGPARGRGQRVVAALAPRRC